jgi:hypothetical protein
MFLSVVRKRDPHHLIELRRVIAALGNGFLGLMSLLSGNALVRHGAVPRAGKENRLVQQFKELKVSIASLKALLAGGDITPEQRKHVEKAIEQLKRLRRKADATKPEIYRCVRQITDELVSAFFLN